MSVLNPRLARTAASGAPTWPAPPITQTSYMDVDPSPALKAEVSRDTVHERRGIHGQVQLVTELHCPHHFAQLGDCLLYTSDAADERSSVDLGGRRIIKKKKK